MPNPWDVPPWPSRGDIDPEKTYAGVGRVISVWEFIESELSALYSLLVENYDDLDTLVRYGRERTFSKRIAVLTDAAERYFAKRPHQLAEAEFDRLSALLLGFSARRHEAAHGVVTRVDTIGWFRARLEAEVRHLPNYMLIPPFYWGQKRAADRGPSFAYTSVELLNLSEMLFTLAEHTRNYLTTLLPSRAKEELRPPPPEPSHEK